MATHTCPGCGQPGVPDRMFACRVDWYRLPRPIRNTIWSAHRRDPAKHAQAVADAHAWYDANPPRQRANPAETRGAALRLMRGELPA
jgi:hypothetical protein